MYHYNNMYLIFDLASISSQVDDVLLDILYVSYNNERVVVIVIDIRAYKIQLNFTMSNHFKCEKMLNVY